MTEASRGKSWFPGSLLARLLLGLSLAVVLPLGAFAYFGEQGLRRGMKESIVSHLLDRVASQTADRIRAWQEQARGLAEMVCAIPRVMDLFYEDPEALEDFTEWYYRASPALSPLGDLMLVSSDERILFRSKRNQADPGSIRRPVPQELHGVIRKVLDSGHALSFFPPAPNPFSDSVSGSRDPSSYAVPLVIPIRSGTQEELGACICLLPFAAVQTAIQETAVFLDREMDIPSREVFLVSGSNFLLHTDRERIGQRVAWQPGFVEEPGGWDRDIVPVPTHASLDWGVGVRARSSELFRSVDQARKSLWWMILLVLASTLGMAALLSIASTRSLRDLEAVTEILGSGTLSARARVGGPREVRTLASALNDMAAQLEADREKAKAVERDRAWTAMARRVAHEIKNPLQPVLLHAQLIQRMLADAELGEKSARIDNSAGVILRQVEALQRIVADFSSLAQASMPLADAETFAPRRVLEELEQLYGVDPDGVTIRFGGVGGECRLRASPLRVQQVLLNLIKNAVEASREVGATEVEVCDWLEDGRWIVEVRDRGPGLPAEVRGRIFKPYYSTKQAGTGLGLTICRRHVETMGGRLELVPREGGGACARVELPVEGSG